MRRRSARPPSPLPFASPPLPLHTPTHDSNQQPPPTPNLTRHKQIKPPTGIGGPSLRFLRPRATGAGRTGVSARSRDGAWGHGASIYGCLHIYVCVCVCVFLKIVPSVPLHTPPQHALQHSRPWHTPKNTPHTHTQINNPPPPPLFHTHSHTPTRTTNTAGPPVLRREGGVHRLRRTVQRAGTWDDRYGLLDGATGACVWFL
jgi:hypothetical protein